MCCFATLSKQILRNGRENEERNSAVKRCLRAHSTDGSVFRLLCMHCVGCKARTFYSKTVRSMVLQVRSNFPSHTHVCSCNNSCLHDGTNTNAVHVPGAVRKYVF